MPQIDDHIEKAMGEGKFDDLPGKGKPLRFYDNPHADPEWRLAHHMLHSSGFTLPWIALRQEIEHNLESARQALRRAWEWRTAALAGTASTIQNATKAQTTNKGQVATEGKVVKKEQVEAEWQRALMTFEAKIAAINRQISDYNIQTPSEKLQLPLRKLEREIQAITGSI